MSGHQRVPRWLAPWLLIAALLIGWQATVRATGTPRWLLPAPSDVALAFVADWDILWPNALVTLSEVLAGFAGATAGIGWSSSRSTRNRVTRCSGACGVTGAWRR